MVPIRKDETDLQALVCCMTEDNGKVVVGSVVIDGVASIEEGNSTIDTTF